MRQVFLGSPWIHAPADPDIVPYSILAVDGQSFLPAAASSTAATEEKSPWYSPVSVPFPSKTDTVATTSSR